LARGRLKEIMQYFHSGVEVAANLHISSAGFTAATREIQLTCSGNGTIREL
jgi:hypothetical protein